MIFRRDEHPGHISPAASSTTMRSMVPYGPHKCRCSIKGQEGVLADVFARANLHQERESHHPFGAPDRRSSFTPQRVAIETTAGDVVEELDQPRASFAGHTLETPWTTLQLAYFVGTAMWTYLTQPFTFALPGFQTTELDPWQENGEQWRRLRVTWRGYLATHNAEQTLYVGDDGLFRRHDYNIDIAGGAAGAHYISGYTEVAGIMIPTKHRIRDPKTGRRSASRSWSR
jgi:hypothetical protein